MAQRVAVPVMPRFVRHSKRPAWGVGRVTDVYAGLMRVRFADGEIRFFRAEVLEVVAETDVPDEVRGSLAPPPPPLAKVRRAARTTVPAGSAVAIPALGKPPSLKSLSAVPNVRPGAANVAIAAAVSAKGARAKTVQPAVPAVKPGLKAVPARVPKAVAKPAQKGIARAEVKAVPSKSVKAPAKKASAAKSARRTTVKPTATKSKSPVKGKKPAKRR